MTLTSVSPQHDSRISARKRVLLVVLSFYEVVLLYLLLLLPTSKTN